MRALFIMAALASLISFWVTLPPQATYHYHGPVALPDPRYTPGKVRTNDANDICGQPAGWTKQFRLTTNDTKRQAFALYGIDRHKMYPEFCAHGAICDPLEKFTQHHDQNGKLAPLPLYEIDHLIALEDGGADDLANLSPQPYYAHPGAHEKDRVETWMNEQVCTGKLSLAEAQAEIATDWYDLYLKMSAPDGVTRGK